MKRVPTPKLCAEIRAEVAQIQATRESVLRETLARLENIRAKIDRSETDETPASASSMLQPVEMLSAKSSVSLSPAGSSDESRRREGSARSLAATFRRRPQRTAKLFARCYYFLGHGCIASSIRSIENSLQPSD
jgi:hypothetical protein